MKKYGKTKRMNIKKSSKRQRAKKESIRAKGLGINPNDDAAKWLREHGK